VFNAPRPWSPNESVIATQLFGHALLNEPLLNKGTAFSDAERDVFELHGLLPPNVATLDEQAGRRLKAFRDQPSDLARYVFLRGLQDSNEVLFYALLANNLSEALPVIYAHRRHRLPRIQSPVPQTALAVPELSPPEPHQGHPGKPPL
jgi:hypothetical protein